MAGFIILQAAARRAAEEREKEEKHEKEMRAKGYTRELVLVNPSFCYTHIYRDLKKQTNGIIIAVVFMCLLTVMINLAIHSFAWWEFWFGVVSAIGVIVGFSKVYNTTYDCNGSKEAPQKPGFKHMQTNHEPRYDWTWVEPKTKKK
jgi:hypothetical protein